jgi:hypothetical protein
MRASGVISILIEITSGSTAESGAGAATFARNGTSVRARVPCFRTSRRARWTTPLRLTRSRPAAAGRAAFQASAMKKVATKLILKKFRVHDPCTPGHWICFVQALGELGDVSTLKFNLYFILKKMPGRLLLRADSIQLHYARCEGCVRALQALRAARLSKLRRGRAARPGGVNSLWSP